MSAKKDFIVTAAYFLILSTVLEAEDAFVYYYDSEFQPQKQTIKNNRVKMLIAFGIITIVNYVTLVAAPYFNCSIQKLAMGACMILLVKYGCELAYYTKILTFVFQLGAIFADVIGTGLFYLTSVRLVQILCDRHQLKNKVGLCFGCAVGLYVFSILLGYAIGYVFFEQTPTWVFVICLSVLTVVAAVIAYISFMFNPRQELSENNQNPPVENNANQEGETQVELFRGGINFGDIVKYTFITYSKVMPLIGVQTMLGTLIAFGYSLLQFLIWTSQTESIDDKLQHNMNTMIIYSVGGMFTSCLIGFICDKFSVRKLGYGLLIYNGISLIFLYFAIYIKYFYTTLILFMFLGMTQFAVLVWLLSACSRLYKGIFQVLAANTQLIAIAASGYGFGNILFEGRMNPQTKLSLELAALIVMDIVALLFIKRLPNQPVSIQYLVEELDQSNNNSRAAQTNQQRDMPQKEKREQGVEIEMTYQGQSVERKITKQETIDPQNLL